MQPKLSTINIFQLLILLLSTCVQATEAIHPQLKAFPEAIEGMQRLVIVVPEKDREQEQALKLEIIPGQILFTDGVNLVRSGASIEAITLQGWGYTYYQVKSSDKLLSTLMAAPDGHRKVEQFVSGKPLLISYNSRLPIVIYAPQDYLVKYRIWEAPLGYQKTEIQ